MAAALLSRLSEGELGIYKPSHRHAATGEFYVIVKGSGRDEVRGLREYYVRELRLILEKLTVPRGKSMMESGALDFAVTDREILTQRRCQQLLRAGEAAGLWLTQLSAFAKIIEARKNASISRSNRAYSGYLDTYATQHLDATHRRQ